MLGSTLLALLLVVASPATVATGGSSHSAVTGAASPAGQTGMSPHVAEATAAAELWIWPVTGPIVRGFDPPDSPYGAGHRGIDIGAPVGTPVLAPAAGRVTFAGAVAGKLYVTIDHGGGVLSTASFLSEVEVRAEDAVSRGQSIGRTGTGHTGDLIPNLHFGVRLDGVYVDPLDYLPPLALVDLLRLAPLAA
jgi:murein DD-endopeptidase MepM/ murein hydrolase activator NlpD